MDLVQIKELMNAMKKAGLKRLSLKEKTGFEIELEREDERPQSPPIAPQAFYHHSVPSSFKEYHPPISTHDNHPAPSPQKEASSAPDNSKYITSPMVGTFYSASSPESAPFVKVGDKVQENTVVCIIEAMKVMNEVKAGVSGTVAEVLLNTGQPVEFAAKLFKIK